jgi:NAD-reducing hydrogenase small subunit
MEKIRLATLWLDGCSGCHMSFLDMDEMLIELADKVHVVYSPLVDTKVFPENVDIALVEGAISTPEDVEKIHKIRANTRILVAFGDCGVTANIPSMRNPIGAAAVLKSVYCERDVLNPMIPNQVIPELLERSVPIHRIVKVDVFLPGCPPVASVIHHMLSELIEGRIPDLSQLSRFGD